MVYAGDKWSTLPILDLYNTQVMAMSILAAKDMYDKGQKRIDDFYEKYGDFTSPILKDMEAYNNIISGVKNRINDIYARGGDPLRNAQDRAEVAQIIRNVPIDDINMLKQSAEIAKEYLKSFDDNTNPELERFLGRDLSNWSTLGYIDPNGNVVKGNGLWGTRKASLYQTIDDLIEPIVKNVDYTYDEDMTRAHNDGNNYYSITRDRLMKAIDDNMSDILATPSGAFHWEKAKQAAAAQGGGEDLARSIFNTMIGNRLSDNEKIKFEADQFKLDDYRTRNDIRAHAANKKLDHEYWKLEHDGDGENNTGYNIPEDVYLTSLAKAAGMEYLPQGGINVNQLNQMMKIATKNQADALKKTGNVLLATGAFMSPEKIGGVIPSDGKDGGGYFLNPNYYKHLHTVEDMRTSYKGWLKRGETKLQSKNIRNNNIQRSKDVVSGIVNWNKTKNTKGDFRLKVVPIVDVNGNNTYSMVGDDNRWHTYARLRVYMSNGKETIDAGNKSYKGGKQISDIPKEGKDMILEVGLHSNLNSATPDLSVSARENLGFYGYDKTKEEIGKDGNTGFPYGTNILSH